MNTKTRHSFFSSSNMVVARDTCRSFAFFASALVVFLGCFHFTEAGGKTLVLLDNANTKETHSIFFNSLKGNGAWCICAKFAGENLL